MDVRLTVVYRVQQGMLHVEYSLANYGNRALLAYDGAPGIPPDSPWPDLGGQIYVSLVADRVDLKRINPPPLPGVNMNRVFVPPVSQVPSGQDRKVRFRMQLPLVERSQYTPDFPGAKYQDRVARTIELWIGYFWKMDSMELQPFPENPNAFRVIGAHGEQKFVSISESQEVSVKARVDNKFQRI